MSSLFALGCPVLDPSARAAHEEADALRVQGPAVPVELPGGVRAWSVTRHAVIKALTSDRRVSRDFRQHWPGRADVPDDWPLAVLTLQKGIFNAYGPAHRRLRRTIAPWFSPQRVEELRPQVQSAADRLIADLAATAPGEPVDLRHALSLPLAMRVICDLFGVPAFLREPLGAAMDALVATTADTEQVRARQGELQFRIGQLLQYKTAHPGTDLTSDLLAPSAGDTEPIPARELRDTLSFVLGAGYETSVNLITGAVHAMLAQPQYLARIGRGGEAGAAGASAGTTSSKRRCATTARSCTCPCATRWRTSTSGRGSSSAEASRSSSPSRRPAAIRTCTRTGRGLRPHPRGQGSPRLRARPPLLCWRPPRPSGGPYRSGDTLRLPSGPGPRPP